MPFDQQQFEVEAPVVVADVILRTLIAARAIIADEKNWATGTRGEDGGPCCAMGALDRVLNSNPYDYLANSCVTTIYLAQFSERQQYAGSATKIAQHNNQLGHAATLRMFDRAIAARKAEVT